MNNASTSIFKNNYPPLPHCSILGLQTQLLSGWVKLHLPWILRRNRTNGIEKEVYYQELAFAVTETENSHSLPSASWRPGKVHGVIQSACEGLRSRRAKDVTPRLRAGEDEWDSPAQAVTRGERGTHGSSFWPLFCWVLSRLGDAQPRGRASYFTQSTDSGAHLIQHRPHRPTQESRLTRYLGISWSRHRTQN